MKINTNFNQLETALAVSGAELKFKYNLVRENQEIINTKKDLIKMVQSKICKELN